MILSLTFYHFISIFFFAYLIIITRVKDYFRPLRFIIYLFIFF